MKRSILVCVAAISLAGPAVAQDKAQKPTTGTAPAHGHAGTQPGGMAHGHDHGGTAHAGMPDMSKMGPGSRKPTNEKQTKKEIEDFFKQHDAAAAKGDFEAMLADIDFPVFMVTDDSKGMPMSRMYSREEYVAMMKPMMEHMPKDMKVTHKPAISVMSDSLASVADDFTMTMGKQKVSGRNAHLLIKQDGKWKWKMMSEAGWGDMSRSNKQPGTGGSPMPAGTEQPKK